MDRMKEPPVTEFADEIGLRGKTEQNKVGAWIDLTRWCQKAEVKKAWETLALREGLEQDAFEKAT
jgi:hypothetical protein